MAYKMLLYGKVTNYKPFMKLILVNYSKTVILKHLIFSPS